MEERAIPPRRVRPSALPRAGRPWWQRGLAVAAAAALGLLAYAATRPSALQEFRSRLDLKTGLLVEHLRERPVDIGGSLPLHLKQQGLDHAIIQNAKAIRQHFNLVSFELLAELKRASPQAFERWRADLRADLVRHRAAVDEQAQRLGRSADPGRDLLRMVEGRLCIPIDMRGCRFADMLVLDAEELDRWLLAVPKAAAESR